MWRTSFGTALWLVILWCVAGAAHGQSDDPRFLDGLRARGLYELAEKYCADQLTDAQLSDSHRADLTIELSRTFAAHAMAAPPAEAPRLWQQAERVVSQFVVENPRNPRLILVRLQGALAAAVQGEAAREATEGSDDAESRDAARDVLREAITKLNALSEEIDGQLKKRGRARANGDELSTVELQSLESNVRYELARALRNQALCYRPSTADRINALSQALEALSPLPRQEPRTRLDWSAALEELACLRLLGEYPTAERRLAGLEKKDPQPDFAGRLRAERIRIALARGQIDGALSEAGVSGATGPEAEMARLEALLAAWRRASGQPNQDETANWQRRAVEQVRTIGRSYGTRQMRKAETLLARAMGDSSGPQSAELLAQAAAGYYRTGKIDRALAAYDSASERAGEMRQPQQAFEAAFTAATIEKERKHYREALERYRALASKPEVPKAAEAHLLAVYCAAQLAQAEQPPNLDEYERLLREHVAAWPAGSTSAQARTWLGRLAVHRGDWQDAIQTLRAVKPDDPQFADAIEAMDQAYQAWFDDMHQRGQAAGRTPDEALQWFESVVPPRGGKPNPATRAAVLAAARIWLTEVPNGALPAERLLGKALDGDTSAPPDWKATAGTLIVVALAAQGKRSEADAALAQVPHTTTQDALTLLQTLWQIRRRANPEVQRNLAELELSTEDGLLRRRNELDPATLKAVTRERAVTLATIGRRNEALAELETLAQAHPGDGQTQEALAGLLASGNKPDLQAALIKWGEVATRSRPGTPRWFRASFGLAQTQLELGQVAAARATIGRVASQHPDFGGDAMKRQFERLSADIEQPPARGVQGK